MPTSLKRFCIFIQFEIEWYLVLNIQNKQSYQLKSHF